MATSAAGALETPVTSGRFLGWRMVGIAALAQFLGSTITLSPFGNFVLPVSETFGVAQGTVGLGIPIAILLMGVLGPFIGRMLDHGRARSLMSGGALVAGVGLLLLAQTRTLAQAAWVFGGLVCAGTACFGMMPAMALVASWFVKRRGLALGLTVAGATIASYLAPVTAEYLIEEVGWRTAVVAFGLLTLAVGVPILAWLTVGRPEDVGQLPDGEPVVESVGGDPLAGSVMLETRVLARDARLWLVAIGFGLVLTSPIVLIGLLVPFGKTELGLTGQQANLFFAAMVPFSLLGKLAIGALADAIPPKLAIVFVVIVNVIVWAIFLIGPSHGVFVATGAIYGIGIGGAAPLQGVVVGLCFGRANFGRANGLGGLVAIPLMATASAASQLLLNATGGYQTSFVAQMFLVALGGLLLLFVRIPRSEAEAYTRGTA